MRWWIQRLATIVAVALVPMPVATGLTPGISSADDCDPTWSRNPTTGECKLPPPVPEWYHAPPTWAPPYAPPDVEPPPPPPSWAPSVNPVWDPRFKAWGIWAGPVWVPL